MGCNKTTTRRETAPTDTSTRVSPQPEPLFGPDGTSRQGGIDEGTKPCTGISGALPANHR